MTNNTSGESNGGLYFIVGGLVVAVAIGAFAYFGGYLGGHGDHGGNFADHGDKTTIERTTTSEPFHDGTTTMTTTTEKNR
jgi:hypothetical protein